MTAQFFGCEKGAYMRRAHFLLVVVCSLFVAAPLLATPGSQTWKVRPGDSLETIATTLEIPQEEIKNHNPGVMENNLQIGQRLKLPLRSYAESKTLEEELRKKRHAHRDTRRKKRRSGRTSHPRRSAAHLAAHLALGFLALLRRSRVYSCRSLLDLSRDAPARF
jgi:LysM repeat protein